MQVRNGNPQQVHSGTMFYPLDPRPEEINILDIAHALAHICRFNGHTKEFYSVAQHSVYCSKNIAPEYALYALLHDAAEAYLCDIPQPLKRMPEMAFYCEAEKKLQYKIFYTFNLTGLLFEVYREKIEKAVKEVDVRALHTEKRDLLPQNVDWGYPMNPYPERIVSFFSPEQAKRLFLRRFLDLTAGNTSKAVEFQRGEALHFIYDQEQ